MGKKEVFIKEIEELINTVISYDIDYNGLSKEANDIISARSHHNGRRLVKPRRKVAIPLRR